MAVKTSEQLKAQFAAGMLPKNTDFADLIDSCMGGYSGPEIYNVFIENQTYDDSITGREWATLEPYGEGTDHLTSTATFNSIDSSDPGTVIIITNKKTSVFYVKVGYYDDGPDTFNTGSRESISKDLVIPPNGSLMLVKVGNKSDGKSTFSAAATAVQGVIS